MSDTLTNHKHCNEYDIVEMQSKIIGFSQRMTKNISEVLDKEHKNS